MGDYYYVDSASVTNPIITSYGETAGLSEGYGSSGGSGAVPWQAIGEAIGTIISSIASASVQEKMARLQEATGMAELRWADENEKFYRKLATESQRKKYMIDVVVMQMRMKAEEEGMRKKKTVWNTVIIAGSLMALGIFIPLMISK